MCIRDRLCWESAENLLRICWETAEKLLKLLWLWFSNYSKTILTMTRQKQQKQGLEGLRLRSLKNHLWLFSFNLHWSNEYQIPINSCFIIVLNKRLAWPWNLLYRPSKGWKVGCGHAVSASGLLQVTDEDCKIFGSSSSPNSSAPVRMKKYETLQDQ